MFELNKVFLAGNLTRDPDLKYLPSGTAIADLGLAINRRMFDRNSGERREETLFVDVTAWEKTAEFCKNYLHKGSAIIVEGRLRQDKWEDKQTGQARSKISVVAERIQFAESKGAGGGGEAYNESGSNEQGAAPVAAPRRSEPERQASASVDRQPNYDAPAGGPGGSTEDDLPF